MSITTPAIAQKLSELTSSQVEAFHSALGYINLSDAETVSGIKTWVNQQIYQNGINITAGDVSIQSGGKLSVNKATGTNIVEIGAAKGALKMVLADTTDGYTEILYGEDSQNKWAAGIWADTFATSAQQNAFYIYQYYDKTGSSVNQTRFIINDSGNIGIGTTTNLIAYLNVQNSLYIQGARPIKLYSASPYGISIQGDTGTWALNGYRYLGSSGSELGGFGAYGNADTLTRFYIGIYNTDEKITILANGNVGIDTTSPSQKLHVVGNSYFNGSIGIGTSTMTTIFNVTGNSYFNGNVGIGTTSPNRLLEVNGVIGAGNSTDGILMYLDGVIGAIIGRDMANTAYNAIEIRTGASPNGIYINTSGNVGIGTNSPSNRLHVYENTTNLGSASGIKIEQANASGDAALTFITSTSTFCMGIDNSVTGDPFRIVYGTDLESNIFFEFNQTYQVISPRIRDNTSASSANVYIDSSSGIIYRSTSSKKVKENINFEIDPGLIFKLKPCEYKSKLDKKNMIGFIAEQVNEIDKRFATGQDNKDGLLGLEINAILAATVAGLQDINKRLIKLEKTK